jgi:hypothetical protein
MARPDLAVTNSIIATNRIDPANMQVRNELFIRPKRVAGNRCLAG